MELLNVPLFFKNNLNKTKNQKSGETHARIFKKNFTATDRRTDGQTDRQTENSQKISLFQIFLKIECSRVPIHFKVAASGAAHPLREHYKHFLRDPNNLVIKKI